MKKEFDIGDLFLHHESDGNTILGWIKDKHDTEYGIEYKVDWADGYVNDEWYSFDWIYSRVTMLKINVDGDTT